MICLTVTVQLIFLLDGYAFSQEENGAVLQVRNCLDADVFNIVKRFFGF